MSTFSIDVIENIRAMHVPEMRSDDDEQMVYGEGYSNALDDVVAMLEQHFEGKFEITGLQKIGAE